MGCRRCITFHSQNWNLYGKQSTNEKIKKLNKIIKEKNQKLEKKDEELKQEKLKNKALENNQKNKHICTYTSLCDVRLL
jgi:hypothetical protein